MFAVNVLSLYQFIQPFVGKELSQYHYVYHGRIILFRYVEKGLTLQHVSEFPRVSGK